MGTQTLTPPGRASSIPVPPRADTVFTGGIRHPELWLWDAWTYEHDGALYLFTLAIARADAAAAATTPGLRNDYPFHIRQFVSHDGGGAWRDRGSFAEPADDASPIGHNLWSGSAMVAEGALLFGYTGIRQPDTNRSFVQSICLAMAEPGAARLDLTQTTVLSDPIRDHAQILDAGYYLPPKEEVGRNTGEEGGPILAWRDPFLIADDAAGGDAAYRAYWSAKVGPSVPAVAQARLVRRGDKIVMDTLLPPIELPDAALMTQAEVPKVYGVPGDYVMLISACDRLQETQPDSEVSKVLRLYVSPTLDGPWRPHGGDDSLLTATPHLFGAGLIDVDLEAREATVIAPYTEMAEPQKQLTFAPPERVRFGSG